jgi:pyruvate dehydrogenase E2 component (dihydrolipoamide acetyltransferase)
MADVVIMPRLSLNEETSLLSQWYIKEGDTVSVGDKLFCIETDKSTMDVDSEFEGTVLKVYYGDYEVVDVLSPVCVIGKEGEEIPELELPTKAEAPLAAEAAGVQAASTAAVSDAVKAVPVAAVVSGKEKHVSPRAKSTAEKNGVTEFSAIRASGADNRIIEKDILRFLGNGRAAEEHTTEAQKSIKLPKIRKVIASNMINSLQSTAQLTISSVFNATAIQDSRERFKNEQGQMKKVTIGDMVLYAAVKTLAEKEFSYMNSWMVSDDEVIEFGSVNLGCAVDTERGLMVPTIFQAEEKSLLQISNDLKELANSCREGNISPDKLKGATFTVTNLGAFGVRTFTPIINPPQVGILGVGSIDYMMKKTKEGLLYYPGCTLSLTFDHRYIDGGPAARFMKRVCENLENFDKLI